jgi:hypothetical protein
VWHIWGRKNIVKWLGNEGERDHLEELVVDGKIILNWSSRNRTGIHLGLDRDKYVAVVNMPMNLRVP